MNLYHSPVEKRIVLVRPYYAGNVGSAVRVAANFGVGRVLLVAPLCSLEEHEFVKMEMGGSAHLTIETVATLEEAVADAQLVVGTSSGRSRDPRPLLTPAEVAARVSEAAPASLALVFGSERGGLSTDELRACQLLLTVPTNPAFPVLNLAQSVGIVLTALPSTSSPPAPRSSLDLPAEAGEFHAALSHLSAALLTTGYLDPVNPARVEDQLRRLLARAVPTRRELAIVRGIASHLTYLHGRRADRG